MNERNAFERQLADEIEYEVGPPRNVDAAAITRAAKTTSPRWRFMTMSSTIKFAVGASILAVAGAALYIAVPTGPTPGDGAAQPGAESATPEAAQAVVTGAVERVREVSPGTTASDAGVSRTEGQQTINRWIASDPRLSGEETVTANWHRYLSSDITVPEIGVGSMTRVLVNDDGRWVGPAGFAFDMGITPDQRDIVVMRGEGAYQGLTAFIVMNLEGTGYAPFVGAIVPGEMPPFPELRVE